ncbi:hypothetical protein MMC11_006309 [Xylographa trunciseda]|nr:hypothetical protein [Xylographa trunciseda]
MGQTVSTPSPTAKFQVIGAGLSRTGTTSFGRALSILLSGPVYHGGTQVVGSSEAHIKSWIKCLQHTPIRSPADTQIVNAWLREVFTGYVACTDYPGAQFTPELLALHPDAKVICTMRDPDRWAESIGAMSKSVTMWHLSLLLWPVPTMRWFVKYLDVTKVGRWKELYGVETADRGVWDKHIEWLKRVVPPERLFFFDVRDGWKPLCEILEVEVPQGVDFPRENDKEAVEGLIKAQVMRGLMIWAGILGAVAVGLGTWWSLRVR